MGVAFKFPKLLRQRPLPRARRRLMVTTPPHPFFGVRSGPLPTRRAIALRDAFAVPDATVYGGCFAVIRNRSIIQQDDEQRLPGAAYNYGSFFKRVGPFYTFDDRHVTATHRLSTATLIGNRFSANYFHWMFDALPKLLGARDDATVIVPAGMPAQHYELLSAVSTRAVLPIGYHDRVRVEHLTVPPTSCCLPDQARAPIVAPTTVRLVAETLATRFPPSAAHAELVLVDRTDYARATGRRNIVNAEAIKDIVRNRGGVLFDPATSSIAEQRAVFSAARIVLMLAGAAFANVVFCRPGATVLCISQPLGTDLGLFSGIADALGVRYGTIYGTGVPNAGEPSHWDVVVDVAAVERGLAWAEGRGEPDGLTTTA